MPLIEQSLYNNQPWWSFNQHFETIIPSIFFKVEDIALERERLELEDGDFLDLDWIRRGNKRLIVLSHGLEGNTGRHYIKRPAKYFSQKGWDILAWNNRGCSGEVNRLARTYYHGDTNDLHAVVQHGLKNEEYQSVVLIGISMGGCQTVKYFGERQLDVRVKGGFAISVSCDLRDSTDKINESLSGFYSNRFVKKVKKKLELKMDDHPELRKIDFDSIKSFDEFHEAFTLKYFSFRNIEEFYEQSSCVNYIEGIDRPVCILNALNDPMLGEKCFPYDKVKNHKHVYLETPVHGGHVGFTMPKNIYSYIEYAAERFIEEVILPSSQT